MKNIRDYNNIFLKIFLVDEEDLKNDFSICTIDAWDSFIHLQLISEIENIFNIKFDTDDLFNFASYEKGLEILKKHKIYFLPEELGQKDNVLV